MRVSEVHYITAIDSTSFAIEDPNNPGVFSAVRDTIRIEAKSHRGRKTSYKIVKK
jgi:hypothetical protein